MFVCSLEAQGIVINIQKLLADGLKIIIILIHNKIEVGSDFGLINFDKHESGEFIGTLIKIHANQDSSSSRS